MLPLIFLAFAAATAATATPDSPDQAKLPAAARADLRQCGPAEAKLAALPDTAWGPAPDAIEAHRALRKALGETMPATATMVLVHAYGGDLASTEFSIALARGDDGAWHGTAVGRNQVWIPGAPPATLPRKAWTLSAESGRRLDAILHDPCLYAEPSTFHGKEVPPVGALSIQVDIVTPTHRRAVSFYGGEALGFTAEIVTLSTPP